MKTLIVLVSLFFATTTFARGHDHRDSRRDNHRRDKIVVVHKHKPYKPVYKYKKPCDEKRVVYYPRPILRPVIIFDFFN